jgi:hypothetical protein
MRKKPFRGYCAAGCGNPVFSSKDSAKYCSVPCAKTRFDTDRGQCENCQTELKRHQYKYCSNRCQQAREFIVRAQRLESGMYPPLVCNGSFIRKYLIQRDGEKCSACGWDRRHPKTGRVPVEVEHIDGDYRNNRPENLTLLCPNCHSLTDTFRALNRGRGRPMRLGGRANPLSRQSVFKDSDGTQPK